MVTTGEVHRVDDIATIDDTSKKEQDKFSKIDLPPYPPLEGMKGFMDTMKWLITSYKKAVDFNKKLIHRIQILETINIGEGKTMADYIEDLKILLQNLKI